MDIIKGVIDKVASRKLAVTAAASAAAATGVVDITMPVAIVAAGRISLVRGWSIRGATEARQRAKRSGTAVRAIPFLFNPLCGYDSTLIEFLSAAKSPLHNLYSPLSALRRAMRPQSSSCPKYSCREAKC
jgi:hypothetical protein